MAEEDEPTRRTGQNEASYERDVARQGQDNPGLGDGIQDPFPRRFRRSRSMPTHILGGLHDVSESSGSACARHSLQIPQQRAGVRDNRAPESPSTAQGVSLGLGTVGETSNVENEPGDGSGSPINLDGSVEVPTLKTESSVVIRMPPFSLKLNAIVSTERPTTGNQPEGIPAWTEAIYPPLPPPHVGANTSSRAQQPQDGPPVPESTASIPPKIPGYRPPHNTGGHRPSGYCHVFRQKKFSQYLPHLRNVRKHTSRVPAAGRGLFFDLVKYSTASPRPSYEERQQMKARKRLIPLSSMKPITNETLITRYILLSDLTPHIVDELGSIFWMNPEFFEIHLTSSGYNEGPYHEDPPSRSWNTHGAKKPFVSMRWFRPVRRRFACPVEEPGRTHFLTKSFTKKSVTAGDPTVTSEKLSPRTNIFRNEIQLLSNPDDKYAGSDVDTSEAFFSAAWEERITILFEKRENAPSIIIVLLDPLPKVKKTITTRTTSSPSVTLNRTESTDPVFDWPQKRVLPDVSAILNRVFNGTRPDKLRRDTLKLFLAGTSDETFDELSRWLNSPNEYDSGYDLLTEILRIITQDSIQLLKAIQDLLVTIEEESHQDFLLQLRLSHWRSLLSVLRQELGSVDEDLSNALVFFQDATGEQFEEATKFVTHCREDISKTLGEIEKTRSFLRSDMTLLESKRGISQAESVGKLTELGFIFIPISCVASLFSMQITEFQNAVSIWVFVLAAAIVVGGAYTVRLTVRARWLLATHRVMAKAIRAHGGIHEGEAIPTSVWLRWLAVWIRGLFTTKWPLLMRRIRGGRKGFIAHWLPVLLQIVGAGLLLLPFLMVWTKSRLDVSFRTMITLIGFVTVTFGLAIYHYGRYWMSSHRNRFGGSDLESPRDADSGPG